MATRNQTKDAGGLVGQRERELETGSNGLASDTQNLLTSLNTALVYSLPLRVGRSSRRNSIYNEMMPFGAGSYEFAGFSFLPGRDCDPPPDWDAWERAENSLEVSAAAHTRTQGGCGACKPNTGWRGTSEKGMLRSSPVP